VKRLAPAVLLPFTLAASAPAQLAQPPVYSAVQQSRAEQFAAEAETAKLEQVASRAKGQAERMRADEVAAAEAIDAAEARITTADTELHLASDYVAAHRAQLASEQQPVASLLAGLAVMARRPPLVALADQASVDELVRVRILLRATLPVIRSRTAKLAAELSRGEQLERSALAARAEVLRSRKDLAARRAQFAALEQQSLQKALAAGGQALSASDIAIAAGEDVEHLRGAQAQTQSALALARQLAAEPAAPPRPVAPEGAAAAPPFAYQLPAAVAVTEGLANVNDSGVRSRGLTLATGRGAQLVAPASGTVRFAGPFHDYDGILIIDHGGGWMSLIVNVASTLQPGSKVMIGDPVGRALGPIELELSRNGQRISPALIAGSSQTLSKPMKGG